MLQYFLFQYHSMFIYLFIRMHALCVNYWTEFEFERFSIGYSICRVSVSIHLSRLYLQIEYIFKDHI